MNEKNPVLVFQRPHDGKYILTDSGGLDRQSASSCPYVGEFKIHGNLKESILMGAQDLREYLDGIKRMREEELENLPNVKSGLKSEIERIEELKEKLRHQTNP